MLIRLIDRSAKSYDSVSLSKLFAGESSTSSRASLFRSLKYPWLTQQGEGATPKAIEERIAKLKREAKALDGPGKSVKTPSASPMGKKRKKSVKGMDMGNENDDEEEEYGEKKKVKEEY